jgi:roadblock/LC7 domain-containing protein
MRNGLLSFAVVLGLAMAATADEKVPLDKVPAKVLEAAKAKFPKATLVSASKEDEDGKIQYELVFKEGEKKFDGIFSPDGKLVALEEVIKEEEVPAAAKEGFKKKYGTDVKLTGYEKITKGDGKDQKIEYEFQFTKGKDKFESVFSADGKFVSEEKVK